MAENVIATTQEFRKLIISKRGFQAASFNRCLHYVRRGVSLLQPVTYVTILNLGKIKELKSFSYRKKANYLNYGLHIDYLATYKFFWSKITASCGVMCVTLMRLPFKHEDCDQYHLLFS